MSDNSDSEQLSDSEGSDAADSSSDSDSDSRGVSSPQKRKRQDSQREDAPRKIRLSPSPLKSALDAETTELTSINLASRAHKRRRREWKWTLGAIPPLDVSSPLSQDSNSTPSSDSSTPTSGSTGSTASRPKLGLNTTLAQSISSASSYTNSSELLAGAETEKHEELPEKKMPGERTPFPRSREGSVESTDEHQNTLLDHQLQKSLEDSC